MQLKGRPKNAGLHATLSFFIDIDDRVCVVKSCWLDTDTGELLIYGLNDE